MNKIGSYQEMGKSMKEQKVIQEQLIKNMIFNLITFTLIFSTLGVILYTQVKKSLYQSADKELSNSQNQNHIIDRIENEVQTKPDLKAEDLPNKPDNEQEFKKMIDRPKIEINPRLIYLIRNEKGEIVNEGNLDRIFNEDNIPQIQFNEHQLGEIYSLSLEGNYSYRAVNTKIEQEGKLYYVQVLINVDAEEDILVHFTQTLIIGILVSVIVSILASFILSKYTLTPIVKSWKKQNEFVQNASHELRTPLTIIQAKQELLLQEPEHKIIDHAEDIHISLIETKRLTKLIKDLMILARADSNQVMIEKKEINIDEWITKLVKGYQEMAEVQQKQINLELNYGKTAWIDPDQIQELLVILLDNSMKYTEAHDNISLKTEEKENKLIIEIKDTGIGISNEGMKHIFDRFYREDKARNRETGGSGLGLAIAKHLVELHKGSIKVEKNGNKGTKMIVKLPNSP